MVSYFFRASFALISNSPRFCEYALRRFAYSICVTNSVNVGYSASLFRNLTHYTSRSNALITQHCDHRLVLRRNVKMPGNTYKRFIMTNKFSTTALLSAFFLTSTAFAVSYDAPTNYYNSATGTGATLKTQLRTIMTNGHDYNTYGELDDTFIVTDRYKNNPNQVWLIYDNKGAYSGWNKEHIWPQSKQPGSASSSKKGHISDQHCLRPCDTKTNSRRGNYYFAGTFGSTYTGYHGPTSERYWYPSDSDAGDVARSLFYSATRYSNLDLKFGPTTYENHGDLGSLIRWHFLDTPDEFELRRNHAIYGGAVDNYRGGIEYNPHAQKNRNAFIDRPEYAWSVYMDQKNDTNITFLGPSNADGSSTITRDFGRVIKGAAGVNTSTNVILNKKGDDGTYYSSTASSNVSSSVNGRYNAFAMGGPGFRNIDLTLNADTNVVGLQTGTLTIDNLDVTTEAGLGKGANDANDVATLSLTVLEHANASFSTSSDLNTLTLDFGNIDQFAAASKSFSIANFASTQYTAGLDLISSSSTGNTNFSINLTDFDNLAANDSLAFNVDFDTNTLGSFASTYTFNLNDEDLPGKGAAQSLTLNILGNVTPIPEPSTLLLFAPLALLAQRRRKSA